jgi:hypothetical protein
LAAHVVVIVVVGIVVVEVMDNCKADFDLDFDYSLFHQGKNNRLFMLYKKQKY